MDAERAYRVDAFSPQVVTRRLEEIVRIAAEFLKTQCQHEHIPELRDHQRTTFALNFWAMALFARLAMPVVPETGQRILTLLGLENQAVIDGAGDFVKYGRALSSADAPHFQPILMGVCEAIARVD